MHLAYWHHRTRAANAATVIAHMRGDLAVGIERDNVR